MENVKEILVHMPRLDEHDNNLMITIRMKEESAKSNEIIVLTIGESTFRECFPEIGNLFQAMFEKEFEELQKKYKLLIKDALTNCIWDVEDLEKCASYVVRKK